MQYPRLALLFATFTLAATLTSGTAAQTLSASPNAIYYPTQGKVVIPRVQLGNKLYYAMLETKGGAFVLQGASLADLSLPANFTPAPRSDLIGTWKLGDATSTVSLTFNADGSYSMQHGPSTDPNCTPAGGPEAGTWQYDSSTGVLDAVATSDSNGECGLSHPNFGPLRIKKVGSALIAVSYESGRNEELAMTK